MCTEPGYAGSLYGRQGSACSSISPKPTSPYTPTADIIRPESARGRSVVVAQEPSKLLGRVRFPSPASRDDDIRGVAQSGSAPGWGPGGRRFKSCLPDTAKALEIRGFRRSWGAPEIGGGVP